MPAYVPKQPGLEEVTTRKPKTAMSPQRNGELGNPTIDDEDEVDDESWEVLDNEGLELSFITSIFKRKSLVKAKFR